MYSYRKPIRRKKSRKSKSLYVTAMVLAVLGIFAAKLLVIFPTVYATADIQDVKLANTLAIPWPAYGQSAVGVKGHGVVSASPNQSARPTASVAKLVTALAILEKACFKVNGPLSFRVLKVAMISWAVMGSPL
mgnify:CR=1 FL=1